MFCADTHPAGTMAPKGSVINPVIWVECLKHAAVTQGT
jgi:hypothetical protein